jgi:hypothetical protein
LHYLEVQATKGTPQGVAALEKAKREIVVLSGPFPLPESPVKVLD